jgi:hypothetical protein
LVFYVKDSQTENIIQYIWEFTNGVEIKISGFLIEQMPLFKVG